jgi:hypothetical protein
MFGEKRCNHQYLLIMRAPSELIIPPFDVLFLRTIYVSSIVPAERAGWGKEGNHYT